MEHCCQKMTDAGLVPKACSSCTRHHNFNLRVLVITCLVISTVVSGYFPYAFFKYLEYTRATQEYKAVVQQTETSFQNGMTNQVHSLRTVDTVMRSTCPDISTWPNCSVTPEVFDSLSESLEEMSGMVGIGMSPLISARNRSVLLQFEQYATDVYLNANFTSFGSWKYENSSKRGVISVGPTGLFHDLEGNPDAPNDYLAPVLHFSGTTKSAGAAAIVLFNINYDQPRFDAIGESIDCYKTGGTECDRITDFVVIRQQDGTMAPAALIVHPLPIEGSVVGLVFTIHFWGDLIEYSIPSYVRGLVVTITCLDRAFTYEFNDGKVSVPSESAGHEHFSGRNRHTFVANVVGKGDVSYQICIYTSSIYFREFEDNRATYASIIGIGISVITTFLFFLYDYFLGRTARENAVILATKRAFVRYISHEIRTPLNTVNVGLKVLMQELAGLPDVCGYLAGDEKCALFNEKQQELMDLVMEVEDSSDTAVGILNDLINYDKISMNNMQLELQVVNIWDLVRESYEPFLIQARQKHIFMTLQMACEKTMGGDKASEAKTLRVLGDSVKLKQVMRNLLSNALKFTPPEGRIEVTVLWESGSRMSPPETPSSVSYTAAGALSIAVKDSGVGISAENQLELFQEGRQFNANRLQGGNGSGLGLFITKGVVHLHGGELSSHSDGEGCGTTFTLVLPVVHTDELESEMDSGSIGFAVHPEAMDLEGGRIIRSAGAKDYTELKTEGHIAMQQLADVPGSVTITQVPSGLKDADIRHVMVVDDSTPSRKMLCRLLTNSGYKCVQAADGQECVDVMVRNREMNSSDPKADNLVQIIFMDYEMPIMNGPEACAALRQLAFQIPIFGVTGNVLPSDKEFFIAKGANEVLSKPLCLDELRNLIRKHSSNRGVLLNISRSSSSHSLTRGSSSHALDRSGSHNELSNLNIVQSKTQL